MPLKSGHYGFITTAVEVVHIFWQLRGLLETLWAIQPPSPAAQFLRLEVARRGSLSSINVFYDLAVRRAEEEATLDPTYTGGRLPVTSSQIVTPVALGMGGVMWSTSSGLAGA